MPHSRPARVLKHALFFTLVAGTCAWMAITAPATTAVGWAYAGTAPLVLAVAYLLGRPGVLGKRPDGRLGRGARFALLPYIALNETLVRIARHTGLVVGPQEVAPGLWVGPRPLGRDAAALAHIRTVIDMTAEFDEIGFLRRLPGYRCFPALDDTSPEVALFVDAIRFGCEALKEGPLYVHCASGHSRSVSVVAGIMVMRGDAATVDEALAKIRPVRPRAKPTADQARLLKVALQRLAEGSVKSD